MSRKFKFWLDSGANCQSSYEGEVTLEELGIEDAEWDLMNPEEQDEAMKEVAWEKMDWGYREIGD